MFKSIHAQLQFADDEEGRGAFLAKTSQGKHFTPFRLRLYLLRNMISLIDVVCFHPVKYISVHSTIFSSYQSLTRVFSESRFLSRDYKPDRLHLWRARFSSERGTIHIERICPASFNCKTPRFIYLTCSQCLPSNFQSHDAANSTGRPGHPPYCFHFVAGQDHSSKCREQYHLGEPSPSQRDVGEGGFGSCVQLQEPLSLSMYVFSPSLQIIRPGYRIFLHLYDHSFFSVRNKSRRNPLLKCNKWTTHQYFTWESFGGDNDPDMAIDCREYHEVLCPFIRN